MPHFCEAWLQAVNGNDKAPNPLQLNGGDKDNRSYDGLFDKTQEEFDKLVLKYMQEITEQKTHSRDASSEEEEEIQMAIKHH